MESIDAISFVSVLSKFESQMQDLATILFIPGIILGFYFLLKPIQQRMYLQDYKFDAGLKDRFALKHPSLTPEQIDRVFKGLKDYFYICHQAGAKMVAMPSQVVDDAWHEFILFSQAYDLFCRKAFGRYLHHIPAEAMTSPTLAQDGIRQAWRLACQKAGINPKQPTALPLLFALDTELAIDGGFKYSLDCPPDGDHYCVNAISCGGGCGGGCGAGCGGGC